MKKLKDEHSRKRVISISVDEETLARLARVSLSPSGAVARLAREEHERRNTVVSIDGVTGEVRPVMAGALCVAAWSDEEKGILDATVFGDDVKQKQYQRWQKESAFVAEAIPLLEKRAYVVQKVSQALEVSYWVARGDGDHDPVADASTADALLDAVGTECSALAQRISAAVERIRNVP